MNVFWGVKTHIHQGTRLTINLMYLWKLKIKFYLCEQFNEHSLIINLVLPVLCWWWFHTATHTHTQKCNNSSANHFGVILKIWFIWHLVILFRWKSTITICFSIDLFVHSIEFNLIELKFSIKCQEKGVCDSCLTRMTLIIEFERHANSYKVSQFICLHWESTEKREIVDCSSWYSILHMIWNSLC